MIKLMLTLLTSFVFAFSVSIADLDSCEMVTAEEELYAYLAEPSDEREEEGPGDLCEDGVESYTTGRNWGRLGCVGSSNICSVTCK
ncbi:MAG: hypothetical protein JJU46_00765 [Balneolaceae bacterium]|nr:hypothetical protein [Balneolaceae bacterium]MCH8548920.1 hypothetical protein [Balneolaceae bacterium]